jgi:hypothetical protein
MAKIIDYAIRYAEIGFAIVPLSPGEKYPLFEKWQDLATTDVEQIREWWTFNPSYNIGLMTGIKSSDIVVVDLDQHPDQGRYGIDVAKDWQLEHGAFPETWEAVTGSGGRHIFFRDPSAPKRHQHLWDNSVDFQADGALIVLPPSRHPNGNKYFWDVPPLQVPLAEIDDNVKDFLRAGGMNEEQIPFAMPDIIPEGKRVKTLFKAVCSMQSKGFSDEAIVAAIKTENVVRCVPPLSDDQLKREVFPALKNIPKGGGADDGRRHEYRRSGDISPAFKTRQKREQLSRRDPG